MALSEKQWAVLASDLKRAVARAAPDWTDHDASDPGITMLEVMAYILEDPEFGSRFVDPRGVDPRRLRTLARRIADRAAGWADAALGADDAESSADDCGPGLQRVRYFSGQILGVDDLRAEQDYARQRLDRRNRLLHGAGIVDGLEVALGTDGAGAPQITIAPGLAFDPLGREICLEGTATLGLPADGKVALLSLSYAERPCRRVPAPADPAASTGMNGSGDGNGTEPSRIVETYTAALAPTSIEDAVAIARLRRVRGRWHVDATFKASRVTA